MKKKKIKAIATILSLALLITMIPVNTVTADAADSGEVYLKPKNKKDIGTYVKINGKKVAVPKNSSDSINMYLCWRGLYIRKYICPNRVNIKTAKVKAKSATVKFATKPKLKKNTKLLYYEITVSPSLSTQNRRNIKDKTIKTKKTSVTFKNLKPNTEYIVYVYAHVKGKKDGVSYSSWLDKEQVRFTTKKLK